MLYALADGAFAVWDPHRNYWRSERGVDVQERVPAYVFSNKEVWDGLDVEIDGKPTRVCNGLLADWASWIREQGPDARRMAAVLALLGPSVGDGSLQPGSGFARLSVDDARDIPTIRMGYGQDVPILYGTVDHFVSCDEDRTKAYDWANYRYAAGWINASKQALRSHEVVDPFAVEHDWFELLLPSL